MSIIFVPLFLSSPVQAQTREQYNQIVAEAEGQVSAAKIALEDAQTAYNATVTSLNAIDGSITIAQNLVSNNADLLNIAQSNLLETEQQLADAQTAYDTSYIPDPDWIRPTKEIQVAEQVPYTVQVAHTETVAETVLIPRIITTIIPGGIVAKVYNMSGYNNAPPYPTENRLVSTQTVSNISYQWGSGYILNTWLSEDTIVNFSGNIYIPYTGTYSFYAPADDGVRMLIDGTTIINDWYDKGGGGSQVSVSLTQGVHSFTLWYYENGGGANVWLYWAKPGYGWEIMPASAFGQQIVETIVYDEVITYREVTTYTEEIRYQTIYHTEVVPDDEATAPLINDPSFLDEIDTAQNNLYTKQDELETAQTNLEQSQTNLSNLNADRDQAVLDITAASDIVLQKQNELKSAQDILASIPPYVEPEAPKVDPTTEVVEPPAEPEPVVEPPVEQTKEEIMAELMAEAQADDIQVPEELAAIPVLGNVAVALADAVNAIGNVGADMTPEVRAQSKKVVISAVIVGQVAQLATQAAAGAAQAAASAASSTSSATRRKE